MWLLNPWPFQAHSRWDTGSSILLGRQKEAPFLTRCQWSFWNRRKKFTYHSTCTALPSPFLVFSVIFPFLFRFNPEITPLGLEKDSPRIFGSSWSKKIDALFLENLGKFRKYQDNSIRDLLRLIRNKVCSFIYLFYHNCCALPSLFSLFSFPFLFFFFFLVRNWVFHRKTTTKTFQKRSSCFLVPFLQDFFFTLIGGFHYCYFMFIRL